MKMSIGIDLGTTNTVVSIARKGVNGNIEVETEKITQIGEDTITPVDSELLPSVLYINEDSIPYVGQVAKAMKSQHRRRVISNSKNYIGLREYNWVIDSKEYTPEVVASYYLKYVRNFLSNKYFDENIIKSAVITVPASFDIDQKRATKTAARLAGFDESNILLISEPTAAMLDFINEQKKYEDSFKAVDFADEKKVLVFDLGGGTCDVAILNIKINGDEVYVEEIAVSPHTLIGGTNFDSYAVLGIIEDYNKLNNIKLEKMLEEETLRDLKNELAIRCEKAKLHFSGRYNNMIRMSPENLDQVVEKLSYPISIPSVLDGKPFTYDLTMKKYDQFILTLLDKNSAKDENVISPITKTLRDAGITKEEVDYVFCVGGMTMYPIVTKTLKEFFNKEPMSVLDRMSSVSRGASVFHYYKVNIVTKEEKNNSMQIDVIPSMPQSVFLNVKNGFPITLIEAGTKAGTPKVYKDLIHINSELGVELELYGGRSVFDPELKKLRNIKLEFPRGVKRGSAISLNVEYTDAGILNFGAWLAEDENIKINLCLDDLFITEKEIVDARKNYNIEKIKGAY